MSAETFRFSSSSLLEMINAEPRAGYEPSDLLTLFWVRNLKNWAVTPRECRMQGKCNYVSFQTQDDIFINFYLRLCTATQYRQARFSCSFIQLLLCAKPHIKDLVINLEKLVKKKEFGMLWERERTLLAFRGRTWGTRLSGGAAVKIEAWLTSNIWPDYEYKDGMHNGAETRGTTCAKGQKQQRISKEFWEGRRKQRQESGQDGWQQSRWHPLWARPAERGREKSAGSEVFWNSTDGLGE